MCGVACVCDSDSLMVGEGGNSLMYQEPTNCWFSKTVRVSCRKSFVRHA
jgi:glutamine cyclotransferase